MRRINIGSGQRRFGTPEAPWINVDSQARWNPDVHADGELYLRIDVVDASVDMICLHHVLEHYGCGEADALLRECHRVLVPGGSLLVFVPDLAELMLAWNSGRIDTQVYMTNIYGAYMGDEADRHRWGYTKQSLKDTLRLAGFDPRPFDWRVIPGADIAGPDFWILAQEAIR
jgi:predicted SAM-dependent methyltransferase